MARDVAAAIMDELPNSSVWLVVYRDYNHQEGFATRKANNGFYFKHFGGDRHNVNVFLKDAPEIYCSSSKAPLHLWSLTNTLSRPRGLELVFMPQAADATLPSECTLWRVGSVNIATKDEFLTQVTPLMETLESVKMA